MVNAATKDWHSKSMYHPAFCITLLFHLAFGIWGDLTAFDTGMISAVEQLHGELRL